MNYNILENLFALVMIGAMFYDSVKWVEKFGLSGFSMLQIVFLRVFIMLVLVTCSYLGISFLFSLFMSPNRTASWLVYLLLLLITVYGLKAVNRFLKNKIDSRPKP